MNRAKRRAQETYQNKKQSNLRWVCNDHAEPTVENLIPKSKTENLEESLEDPAIRYAKDMCEKLYQTPTYRAYVGIKSMLDRLAKYMETTQIEHGRDGNINALVNAAAKFEQIRQSYKGAFSDMKDEQQSSVRGGAGLAYDQM